MIKVSDKNLLLLWIYMFVSSIYHTFFIYALATTYSEFLRINSDIYTKSTTLIKGDK